MKKKKSIPPVINAYELMIKAIESGELPSGSRLRENDLAARFGISRTPIREALRRLETQGLVTHVPRQGAIVCQLTYSEIGQLYYMREVLEGTAARLATMHATDVEVAVLREMIEADHSITGNPRRLAQRNRLFHRQIYLIARNRFLLGFFENMQTSLSILAGTTLAIPMRGSKSLEEHSRVVDAIAAHDPDAAETAAREHMHAAFKARLDLLTNIDRPADGA
jgi:DNA-binding GntR family transcriptional regulator